MQQKIPRQSGIFPPHRGRLSNMIFPLLHGIPNQTDRDGQQGRPEPAEAQVKEGQMFK